MSTDASLLRSSAAIGFAILPKKTGWRAATCTARLRKARIGADVSGRPRRHAASRKERPLRLSCWTGANAGLCALPISSLVTVTSHAECDCSGSAGGFPETRTACKMSTDGRRGLLVLGPPLGAATKGARPRRACQGEIMCVTSGVIEQEALLHTSVRHPLPGRRLKPLRKSQRL